MRLNFLSVIRHLPVIGALCVVAQTATAESQVSPIEPPLDGKHSLSSPLLPWLGSNGLYGYADRQGVVQIPPRFTEARPFYEGLAAVAAKDGKDWRWGYIQPSGTFQIEPRYGDVGDFLDGKALVLEQVRKPVGIPFLRGNLVSGNITERTIDRRGVELDKRDALFGDYIIYKKVEDRQFERYPRPPLETPGWQILPPASDKKAGARRLTDGKVLVRANHVVIIQDAVSGEARFIAGHDWNQPWSVWNLEGKPLATALANVFSYASEGCFYAAGGPQGWWAAFEASGRRLTPYIANKPFFFRDGIAEAEAVQGIPLYVDRSGRLYVEPGYLETRLAAMGWKME